MIWLWGNGEGGKICSKLTLADLMRYEQINLGIRQHLWTLSLLLYTPKQFPWFSVLFTKISIFVICFLPLLQTLFSERTLIRIMSRSHAAN